MEVIDAAGRLVSTVASGILAAGRREYSWDGLGARGPVRSGLYWVRLAVAGREPQVRRIMVVN
jgi:hypothetical protein